MYYKGIGPEAGTMIKDGVSVRLGSGSANATLEEKQEFVNHIFRELG